MTLFGAIGAIGVCMAVPGTLQQNDRAATAEWNFVDKDTTPCSPALGFADWTLKTDIVDPPGWTPNPEKPTLVGLIIQKISFDGDHKSCDHSSVFDQNWSYFELIFVYADFEAKDHFGNPGVVYPSFGTALKRGEAKFITWVYYDAHGTMVLNVAARMLAEELFKSTKSAPYWNHDLQRSDPNSISPIGSWHTVQVYNPNGDKERRGPNGVPLKYFGAPDPLDNPNSGGYPNGPDAPKYAGANWDNNYKLNGIEYAKPIPDHFLRTRASCCNEPGVVTLMYNYSHAKAGSGSGD